MVTDEQYNKRLHENCDAQDLIGHLAEIEAGWTLPKPWKSWDSEPVEKANRDEMQKMVERWRAHGIEIK